MRGVGCRVQVEVRLSRTAVPRRLARDQQLGTTSLGAVESPPRPPCAGLPSPSLLPHARRLPHSPSDARPKNKKGQGSPGLSERETGLEPATSTLARSRRG